MSENVSKIEEEAVAQSKPHSPSKTMWVFLSIIGFAFSFFIGFAGVSPFSQIPSLILTPILCSLIVILVYSAKSSMPEFSRLVLILLGAIFGGTLNGFLTVDFLAKPSIISVVVELSAIIVACFAVLRMMKYMNLYENLRCVFLGVSLISILFAFSAFFEIVQGYLPLLPSLKLSPFVYVDFSLIVNIFKSLFLTGLFSFFERLLRIIEEEKR